MKLLDEAKQFFWLRRIALALERQADIAEKQFEFQQQEFAAKYAPVPRKKTEFSLMDQEAINKDYLRRLEAERDGIELDD
jgi:hypothetical protein